jgi:hypothetical protein
MVGMLGTCSFVFNWKLDFCSFQVLAKLFNLQNTVMFGVLVSFYSYLAHTCRYRTKKCVYSGCAHCQGKYDNAKWVGGSKKNYWVRGTRYTQWASYHEIQGIKLKILCYV